MIFILYHFPDYRLCDADQFTCDNHQCIPEKNHCDGTPDCFDRSDEIDCSKLSLANNIMYMPYFFNIEVILTTCTNYQLHLIYILNRNRERVSIDC